MVQVHTVYEAPVWRCTVDGLRQAYGSGSRVAALAHGRRLAVELGAQHVVHDVDGSVTELTDYSDEARHPETLHYIG